MVALHILEIASASFMLMQPVAKSFMAFAWMLLHAFFFCVLVL